MSSGSILVVEDNAITRRMFRVALASQGWSVSEAGSCTEARERLAERLPDLVLVDLTLPDGDGNHVLTAVRERPGGADVPVLAMSGFLSKLDQARALTAGFAEHLYKPVEPQKLLEAVEVHRRRLTPGRAPTHAMVINDEPTQLIMLKAALTRAGMRVTAVGDSRTAHERATAELPDVIVSDVLMPGEDGFQLCLQLRRDPRLAHVPVVLHSVAYTEEADQALAHAVGASLLVAVQDDVRPLVLAVERAVHEPPRAPTGDVELPTGEYVHRLARQVERQYDRNAELASRLALYEASMSVLARMEEATRRSASVHELVGELLSLALDAAGISLGMVYLQEPDGSLVLGAHQGFSDANGGLSGFYGHAGLLRRALERGELLHVPAQAQVSPSEADLLMNLGAQSVILASLMMGAKGLGVLVLAAARRRIADEWMIVVETVARQIAQAIALARTVGELARERERLHESESTLRQITDSIDEVFYMSTPDLDRMIYISPAFEAVWGRPRAEVYADSLSWASAIHPDDRERAVQHILQYRQRGEPFDVMYRIIRPDGTERWIRDHAVPVRDAAGEIVRFAGTATDVTALKQAEAKLDTTTEQLRHAQKMEAVGRLAGGVAHDFNNLLTVIVGVTDMALEGVSERDPFREELNTVRRAADRATSLTRQLLVFSRQERVNPQVLEINTVMVELEKMLRRLIGEDVELTLALDGSAGHVRVDRGYLEQVVVNLCVNARDAMPSGGSLVISTERVAEVPRGAVGETATPGAHVCLSVQDSGSGIPPDVQGRIFEPFFTTKERGKGTGLGLSTVYGIVNGAGGRIAVRSAPARGTTFAVYLPAVPAPVAAPAQVDRTSGASRGHETVLLVEDDELVRDLSHRQLRRAGFEVLVCADGAEALATVERHGAPIHLVITDVVMPKMSGPELVSRLQERLPRLRVIFCSGYTAGSLTSADLARTSGSAFLQKPFSGRDLTALARTVLDENE